MTDTITTASGLAVQVSTGDAAESAAADGFNSFGRRPVGISPRMVAEAAALLSKALKGNRRAALEVQEAFSTSDFTLAAFATIEQEMIAQYEEKPSVWQQYTAQTTVRDFKPKHLRQVWREKFGLDKVPELTEYKNVDGTKSADATIQVGKFGNRYAISMEAWINDEAIDEIGDIPAWFSNAADETEAVIAASNLVRGTGTGVNTAFFRNYTSGTYSGINNSPVSQDLTLENLDNAIESTRQRKVKGRVVVAPALKLVVGPSLQTKAERLLAIREIRRTEGTEEYLMNNYLVGQVTLVVDPALEVVNTTANASKTWFLVPDPNGPRPAVYAARLRGHETPEIRVKADTGQRVGGGAISPQDGSFEIDDIQYRVRHIFGGAAIDPTFTFASTGA